MNAVQIVARLTTAPTVEERGGTQVGRLRLAVQRQRGKDGEDRGADFIDVTVFGRQAETCAKYLAKGRRVAVEGHLHHSEWEAEDGSRRQKLEVIARSVEFLDAPPDRAVRARARGGRRIGRRRHGGTPGQGRPATAPPTRGATCDTTLLPPRTRASRSGASGSTARTTIA